MYLHRNQLDESAIEKMMRIPNVFKWYEFILGVIGPMLVDEIEKYVRETNRTDDVHWLKISHIGK